MYTVKGRIENGVILPDEPLDHREGESVLITFVESDEQARSDLDALVARIAASGPSLDYTPPKTSLAELLAVVQTEEPIDSAEWNREWAIIEAEMKARDLADDRAEGRL